MERDILSKVQDVLSSALGIDRNDVKPESSLTRDLGAESIDFIDIIFRLEKAFDIKIPSGELFPANILSNELFVKNGVVTPEGLKELKSKYPYLQLESFSQNPQIGRLAEQFTVNMILRYLEDRLNKKVQA